MNIPQPLLDDIVAGKCLPFIGAGFSSNAHLPNGLQMPTWPELTEILAKDAKVSPDCDGPFVASAYEKKFGHVQLIEAIRKALHADHAESGEAHKAFVELPFDTIYTTNFDLLLEDSYSLVRKPFRSLVGELQMPFHGGPLTTSIVKMHGDLRHEEYIIVTQEDYDSYLTDYPVIATHLSAMLITRTALFIGYSLSDPDFNNIREIIRSRLGKFERMAYIIQFDVSPDDVEKMLAENLHVISISTESDKSKDSELKDLFTNIQQSLDIKEGTKFRAARPEIFEEVTADTFEVASRSVDSSSLLTSSSNLCFVIIPFNPNFNNIYGTLIKPVAEKFGLTVLRADDIYSPGSITEQIRTAIQQARLCIADVSDKNPNVLYEVGIAHSLGKPTVLLTKQMNDVPFDLKSMRVVGYDPYSPETAELALEHSIQQVLGEDRFDEAQRLIESGMYRAAVAMLGVLLEHSFRRLITKYNDVLSKKSTRRQLGLGQALPLLTQAEVIRYEDSSKLSECIAIRNKAVHDLEEPRANEARFMLDLVKQFIERYLDKEFLEVN